MYSNTRTHCTHWPHSTLITKPDSHKSQLKWTLWHPHIVQVMELVAKRGRKLLDVDAYHRKLKDPDNEAKVDYYV